MDEEVKNYFLDSYRKNLDYFWDLVTEKNVELKTFVKIVKKEFKKPKILDIGCGTGKYVFFAAKFGCSAYGIDISQIAIKKAKKYALQKNINVNLRVGDILNVKYPKNYFDAVIDFSCFTHFHKKYWNDYFRQISRILKPWGYILISVWSKNSKNLSEVNFNPKTSKRNWNITKQERIKGKLYTYYFTRNNILRLFESHKFNVLSIKEKKLNSYTKFMPGSNLKLWFVICRKTGKNK